MKRDFIKDSRTYDSQILELGRWVSPVCLCVRNAAHASQVLAFREACWRDKEVSGLEREEQWKPSQTMLRASRLEIIMKGEVYQ